MKRAQTTRVPVLTGLMLLSSQCLFGQASAPVKQPVYIVLTADVGDFINWKISDERLRRTLPVLEKYRRENPSLNATVYFSGAMSEALAQQNSQDHLLDFIKGYIQRGVIKPAYDGLDEPTYENHPKVIFREVTTPAERWRIRMHSAKEVITEGRDPKTGRAIAGKTGGLTEMQEVFGPAAVIRGIVLQMPNLWGAIDEVGDDGEIVNTLREFNKTAIMVGLYESDLGHASGSMFRPWADSFSKVISPEANTSPELFWQEDVLRLSETSTKDWRTFRAEDGVDALKKAIDGLDRSRARVLHVEVGGQRIYVKPPAPPQPKIIMPIQWAYAHPDNPRFPDRLAFSQAEIDASYARQDEVLKYLATEFLPANSGSRFSSPEELKGMVKPGYGYDVPFQELHEAVGKMVEMWGDKTTPPAYLKVNDRYLSLADLFEVLDDSLAQRSQTGKFPASVRVSRVFAPISTESPIEMVTGEVRARTVGQVCAKILPALHDESWDETPHNAIPSPVEIDGMRITAAQFLRLMSDALLATSEDAKLTVKPEEMFAGRVMTYYTRRLHSDLGAPWTYKPAVIVSSQAAN